ncbi:hypothetical protein [Emergencia sp. 1XD21-10]|uniref:hypothetical protein n=1 Tax=Emergencia sp. 1XD21-10 TaxID=2304569 RepID=UPI001379EEF9|nr:hypothetical protein [Emergencia sp. 1XD21-10]NCE98836.1 hypothetical protein [Emergencia sp. 1XD21-10]
MKKKMITALCALTLTLGTAGSCFAAETNPQTTQAYINVPATAIDFSVTEEIIFTGTADSADLTANDLEVTNNSKIGVLTASIEATGDNGWTVVADSTNFARLGANAKKIGIMAAGTHDMSTGAYTGAGNINPTEKVTVPLSGKTGRVTAAQENVKVANFVTTVSVVE